VKGHEPSEVVRVVCAAVGPFVTMFGIYVIAHGHYGPGGGFAGGVVVAMAVVLTRMIFTSDASAQVFPQAAALPAMAIGMALFLTAGFVPMLGGGTFLDYAASPIAATDDAYTRYLGIFVVEVGVGLVVAGGMVLIYDLLVRPDPGAPGPDSVESETTEPDPTVAGADASEGTAP
jgi:multicomponent Na+:H+ antiporter subunit B